MAALQQPSEPKGTLQLIAKPHPFLCERLLEEIPVGWSVDEIVGETVHKAKIHPSLIQFLQVRINGVLVPYERWPQVRPKRGTEVIIHCVPQGGGGGGGGGKSPLKIVLSLALAAVASYAAFALAAEVGTIGGAALTATVGGSTVLTSAGMVFTGVVGGAISMVGNMLLNSLIPAPNNSGNNTASNSLSPPALSITGTANQSNPYGPVPKVYGQVKVFPLLGATPYNESTGNNQFIRQVFVVGYGPLNITNIQIGQTPIEAFSDCEVEIRQGYLDDAPLTLYTQSVNENPLSIVLTQTPTTTTSDNSVNVIGSTLGSSLSRVMPTAGDSAYVTLNFPAGIGSQTTTPGSGRLGPTVTNIPATASFQVLVDYGNNGVFVPAKLSVTSQQASTNWSGMSISGNTVTVSGTLVSNFSVSFSVQTSGGLSAVQVVRTAGAGIIARWNGYTAVGGALAVRTTEPNTTEISVDIEFIEGLATYNTNGGRSTASVTVAIYYRPTGTNAWTFVTNLVTTDNTTSTARNTYSWTVPKGQYDVQLTRLTPDHTNSTTVVDQVTWSMLRSINTDTPITMPGLALIAVRIEATNQLNGALNQLSCMATSILPTWNGSAWVPQPTRNPAWVYCDILKSSANKLAVSDSRIDLPAVLSWAEQCDVTSPQGDGPMWTHDAVYAAPSTVFDMLNTITKAARAQLVMKDGLFSVVTDQPQAVPVQHFTPRNSWGFKSTKNFVNWPHALRVGWVNPDVNWQQDQVIVYDDGYDASNATLFESISMPWVTRQQQAWRDGRYYLAASKLRPEVYELTCDIEGLVCRVGDLVRVSHDVPQWGTGWGRVTQVTSDGSGNALSITLDEQIQAQPDQNYSVRIRLGGPNAETNNVVGKSVVAAAASITVSGGDPSVITFTSPIPATSAPEVGDLVMVGLTNLESVELLVKSITRGPDLTAVIQLLDYSPPVYTSYAGAIPAFATNITTVVPATVANPPPPSFRSITDTLELYLGAVQDRIDVTLGPAPASSVPIDSYQLQYQVNGAPSWTEVGSVTPGQIISVRNVVGGQLYNFRARAFSKYGYQSDWVYQSFTPIGLTAFPSDVTGFNLQIVDGLAHLSWDATPDLDVQYGGYFQLRYDSDLDGPTWEAAQPLINQIAPTATSITAPALIGTYLIKAVDSSGNVSKNAAAVSSNVQSIAQLLQTETFTEEAPWGGTMTNLGLEGTALCLVGQDSIDGILDIDSMISWDFSNDGVVASGTYDLVNIIDCGVVCTARLSAVVDALGVNVFSNVDAIIDFDRVTDLDGLNSGDWDVQLLVSKTNDDPHGGSPTWTTYSPFVIGDYTARAYRFRLSLKSFNPSVTPQVTSVSCTATMAGRLESKSGLLSSASGPLTLNFDTGFFNTPAIGITAHDLNTGDYWRVTGQSSTQFTIQFFNSSGSTVQRTFDYTANGIGQLGS